MRYIVVPYIKQIDHAHSCHELNSTKITTTNDQLAKESYTRFYNRKHGALPLTQFEGGESVRVKTDAQKVCSNPTVVVRADTPRSYIVQAPAGSTFRSNRRHLQEIPVPVTERQFVPDVASNGSPAQRLLAVLGFE